MCGPCHSMGLIGAKAIGALRLASTISAIVISSYSTSVTLAKPLRTEGAENGRRAGLCRRPVASSEHLGRNFPEGEGDLLEVLIVVDRRHVDVDRALEKIEGSRTLGRGCSAGCDRVQDRPPVRVYVE